MSTPEVTSTQTDVRLLDACIAGDQDAWAALVDRYSRLVYSIALKSGLDDEDAADLVQTVFTIVLRRLESLQHVDRFSAWLITISQREAWRMRRARHDTPLTADIEPVDGDPAADTLVIAWEHAFFVQGALRQLGERCRELIDRLFFRDPRPSYESIAADLGIAVGSIGPIRARCLRQLRDHLGGFGIVDPGH